MISTGPQVAIRKATPADTDQVAEIWSLGWQDGHRGFVPPELVDARTEESFGTRASDRVADTTVAILGCEVAGFGMVVDDEVEQVYVSARHRGSGVAAILLNEAERQVRANGYQMAWLAVVAGNARARAFYEKAGWQGSVRVLRLRGDGANRRPGPSLYETHRSVMHIDPTS